MKLIHGKVMILGAGRCQVPLIRKAKKIGLTTIVVSCEGDYPGFKEADIALPIDVKDHEQILRKAKNYKIDGILTNQTDLPVVTAAYVAEKLGLPGIGLDIANNFTNKYRMRDIAEKCGSHKLAHHKVVSLKEAIDRTADMKFPLVIKPIASQGSRGVNLISTNEDLIKNFYVSQSQSISGEVVIEEYFEGREVTVDSLVNNSNFYDFILGEVEMFNAKDKFIPKSIVYPADLNNKLKEIVLKLNRAIVKEMQLPFGLTHGEYRVCENTGEVILLEIAARGGGMYISSDLVPLACGLEVEEVLLKQSLGIHVVDNFQKFERASAFFCPELPCGNLLEIKGLVKASQISGVHRIICDLKNGDKIEPMENKTSRPVVYLLSGETRKDLYRAYQSLKDTLVYIIKK